MLDIKQMQMVCPYGTVGDVLWSRETACIEVDPESGNHYPVYKADCPNYPLGSNRWTPSIHVPKIYSRIWERITDIRVERLQDISEEDAIAEGIIRISTIIDTEWYANYGNEDIGTSLHPIESYRTLWESINGEGSWIVNPWVWAITTEVLSTTGRPKELSDELILNIPER